MPKKSNKKDDSSQQIVDVSKPGSIKPSDNSKNIIIKTSALLKDPMVLDKTNPYQDPEDSYSPEDIQGAPPLKLSMSKKLNIQPLDKELEESLKNNDSDTNKLDNKDLQQLKEEPNAQIDSTTAKLEIDSPKEELKSSVIQDNTYQKEEQEVSVNSNEASNMTDDQNGLINRSQVNDVAPDKEEQMLAQAKAKRRAELQELVLNKKYFLPINKTQKRKNKEVVIIGIIISIILIILWIDISLDAGIIHIFGLKPFTHFFSN